MIIQVDKEDIWKIGNTWSNEDGFLAIICKSKTANIEEILLRSILRCFDGKYYIVRSQDFIWQDNEGENVYDIQLITNMPYEIFEEFMNDI